MDFAARLERDGPVAVKFQLIFPALTSFGRASVRSSSIGSMKRPFVFAAIAVSLAESTGT